MPRKVLPFFAVRGDFEASLAQFCETSLFLHQAAKVALLSASLAPDVKAKLAKAADAWEKSATSIDESEG